MTNEYHRMIYYQPDDDDPDLVRGMITYLGNGALLIAYGGMRIVADPCLRADGLPPPVAPEPPEAILLSCVDDDDVALERAAALDREVPLITTPDLVDLVERHDFLNVHPLETWRGIALRKGDASITITALPGQDPASPERPLMGSMLEFRGYPDAEPYRVYLSGGTGAVDRLDEIADRYPHIDLGVITMTSTRLDGTVVAIDARDAVRVLYKVKPALTIPVHRVDDIFTWPHRDFRRSLGNPPPRVHYLWPGNRYSFPVTARHGHHVRPIPALPPAARTYGMAMAGDDGTGRISN